jgi:hypothetical protein
VDETNVDRNVDSRKVILDSEKHLVTVSSASLVLLATFLKDLFRDPKWDILVGITFGAFLLTLLAGVYVLMFYPLVLINAENKDEDMQKFMYKSNAIFYIISMLCFFVGVASLALFGLRNFYA